VADRELTVRLGADISAYQRAMGQASNSTLNVGTAGTTASNRVTQGFKNAAKIGATVVVAAAGVGVAKILSIGMAYEQQMQTLQAVSQATDAKMQQVSATARQLGSDLEIPNTSAADAAAAMTELAKGGLSVDQAMAAAKGTLQLAAAAQIDGGQAAEIQSNALNAFGLSAESASHVSDVLANAANAASGEITDFASGLQQSSAVASSFGISLDDTTTVLGLFANRGIQGSDAGTSFKTMLIAMANPTAKAQAALEKLGVTVNDAQGNFVGMRAVTDQLSQAKGRMTQAEFASASATAFGTDAMRAAVVMADGGVASFDAMSAAVGRQGGAADLASAQTQGLSGALGVMQSGAEDVAIAFYERFSPAIESAVRDAAERLPQIADAVFDVLDKVAVVASAVGPAMAEGLQSGASDLKTQAEQLLLPLLDGAKDLGTKALPYVMEFGERIWDALLRVGDAVAPVARAIGELFSTLADNGFIDGLGTALVTLAGGMQNLASALQPIGAAIGWVIDLVGMIPGPVAIAAGAFTALVLLGPMIQKMLITVLAYLITMPLRIAVNMQIAAIWTQRLMASLGPVGWAITALGTAATIWASQNDTAAAAVQAHADDIKAFTATLDENSGALTGNSAAQVRNVLESEGKLQILKDLGVSTQQYVDDIMNQVGAEGKAGDAIREAGARAIEADENYQKLSRSLAAASITALDLAEAATSGNWDEVTEKVSAFQKANLAAGTDPGPGMNLTVEKLQNVGTAAQSATDVMGGLTTQTDKVGKGLDSAARVIEATGVVIEGQAGGWRDSADSYHAASEALDGVYKAAYQVPDSLDGAATAIKAVKDASEEADTAAQGLSITMDQLAGRAPDAEKQIRLLASSIRDYGSATRDVPAAQREAKQATDDVTQAQIDLRSATEDLQKLQSDGKSTQDEITSAKLKETSARRKVKDAVDAEAAAKSAVKDAEDKLIDTGRQVYDNAVKMASAAGQAARELHGTAAGADAAAASMATAREDFIKSQSAADQASGAAAALATKLGLVPSEVRTAFFVSTGEAQAAVDDFMARNTGLSIGVRISGTKDPSLNFLASVGGGFTGGQVAAIQGFASGGGMLPGTPPANPRQDNLLGISPNGLIKVRSREWLIQQPTADAIGPVGMSMVNSGALNGLIAAAAAGQIPAFASGGVPSANTIAGMPNREFGDRGSRVVDALEKVAEAVDNAASVFKDRADDEKKAHADLVGAREDAGQKNKAAATRVSDEKGDLARVKHEQAVKVRDTKAEQEKRVAEAKSKQTTRQAEVKADEDRKVQAAKDRAAQARNSTGKGRDARVAAADKAVLDAEAARQRAIEKTATTQKKAVEKAEAAQVRANEKAERQQAKSVGFAERQLAKAERAQDKVNKGTAKKVALAEEEYKTARKATDAARDTAKAAAAAEKKQKQNRADLVAAGIAYDKYSKQIEAARDAADGLREDRAAASASVAGAIAGHGGGITGASDLRLDAASVITGMQQNLGDIQGFAANIEALRTKGLDSKLIQDIANQGIDGGGTTAAALAGATKEQIAMINKLNGQINDSAKKTGDGVGDSLYKAGIQAADGIVAGLVSKQSDIDKAMKDLGKSIAQAMKDALGIKSPSTVMRDQVGAQIVNGVIAGVDSRQSALDAKMSGLAYVPTPEFVNPAEGVFSSYSGVGTSGGSPSSVQVELRVGGDGQLAQFVRDHAEIVVNGAIVKTAQVLVRSGGQG